MFIQNVFTEQELGTIHKDLDQALECDDWDCWAKVKKLAYGFTQPKGINKLPGHPSEQGIITFREITGPVKDLLRLKLARIDSSIRGYDFKASYQVWDIGASIGAHTDASYMFNATFYLNKDWSIDDGGLYIYQALEQNDEQYQVYVPKYNSCSYTNQTFLERHLVTPVTESARERRYTIHCKGIEVAR